MKKLKIIALLVMFTVTFLISGCHNSDKKVINNVVSFGGFCSIKDKLSGISDPEEIYKIVQSALDEGMSLDLTDMDLKISKPLVLFNQNIYGGSITYTGNDGQPVIKLAGKCIIENVEIVNTCDNNECGEGKYVGIWLSNEKGTVESGSVIGSIFFRKCGTLIYAPSNVNSAACGLTIENLRAESWYFRGIDFQSSGCNNNSFSNLYICSAFAQASDAYKSDSAVADSAFYLKGCNNASIKQLNVEHCNLRRPIVFENCKDLDASTIHIEGMNIADDEMGYLNILNTSGRIGAVDFYWTRVYAKNNGAIVLGESSKDGDELLIETFLVKGLHDPSAFDPGVKRGLINCGMKLIKRDQKYQNPYFVTINNYVPFTFQNDSQVLEEFYADKDNITFKKIGQLPAGGPTSERPKQRLCKGYTEYFDTTLEKMVIWNGKTWE